LKENERIVNVHFPIGEKGLRGLPHGLFLGNETGFLNLEAFQIIMEEFSFWWNTTRTGLNCFLISDNLRTHTIKEIVETAKASGIHM